MLQSTLPASALRRDASAQPAVTGNPFLDGFAAPVGSETTETNLRITGELPRELNGLYARIGPNPVTVKNAKKYHWFLGDGMVHGIRLRDGKALWYRNRWIGSDPVNKALGRPRIEGPRRGVSGTVNTNVYGHAGRIWASTEAGVLPVELDGELNSLRYGLFDSPRSLAYTAHPHLDPHTGDLHAICYDAMSPKRVQYLRIDARGQLDRVVDIPVQHGPMIHDCAVTQSKVLVLDLPVTFTLMGLLTGRAFPYKWNPKHAARIGVLPRDGGAEQIRWFNVDPCFIFHTCNAFDLPDGSVVMDAVVHARMFDRSRQGPELDGQISFERWTLPAGGDTVQRQRFNELKQEFPRLDERLVTRPYRYAYSVGFGTGMDTAQPLYRLDLQTGQTVAHSFGPHHLPGEAVFVPRDAASAEDDGWLITLVYDAVARSSSLVVLNAQDLGGEPQAVVHLNERVPAGFHGNWIPDLR